MYLAQYLLLLSAAMPAILSRIGITQIQAAERRETSSLAYLKKKEGAMPWELWKTQPLQRRLSVLLGPKEFKALQTNMDPASPMTMVGGIMSSSGNRAHMGYEEEGVLIIDVDHDVAEVLLLHAGREVRIWAEGGKYVPVPAQILTQIQHWPQAQLKQALASLQHPK